MPAEWSNNYICHNFKMTSSISRTFGDQICHKALSMGSPKFQTSVYWLCRVGRVKAPHYLRNSYRRVNEFGTQTCKHHFTSCLMRILLPQSYWSICDLSQRRKEQSGFTDGPLNRWPYCHTEHHYPIEQWIPKIPLNRLCWSDNDVQCDNTVSRKDVAFGSFLGTSPHFGGYIHRQILNCH